MRSVTRHPSLVTLLMPRTLPPSLTTALDSGSFTAYAALGRRNYDATPPTALVDYTTLITNILYYKYDGLNLTVKYASPNLPATDGLTIGEKYYLERGVLIAGTPVTIKTASLRFDDYSINRQIITAKFSLFSPDARPDDPIEGHDTWETVLDDLNPNAGILGTTYYLPTPENTSHWGYIFYPTLKHVSLTSYASLLPLIRQKYLVEAVDNSDYIIEDEIKFYHLRSPVNSINWRLRSTEALKIYDVAYSPTLDLFVAVGIDAANNAYVQTSNDQGVVWNPAAIAGLPFRPHGIAWSPELELFAMCGTNAGGAQAIATSPDGTTWTWRNSPNTLYAMVWSPELSLFVAMGRYIATSSNGITWTERTNPTTQEFPGICWSADLGLFAAVSWGTGAGERVLTSSNGIDWTERVAFAATNWKDVCWSAELGLFCAVSENGVKRVMTSPDGITWTGRTHAEDKLYESVAWSPFHGLFYACADTGELMYSADGTTWFAEAEPTNSTWEKIFWSEDRQTFVLCAIAGVYNIITSVANLVPDHTITQGDITILRNGVVKSFMWKDEVDLVHTAGLYPSIVHNLGYLESTDSPPEAYTNADRGKATVGIHLKYKTGDLFKLKINASQTATYMGRVTEILDPAAAIGWRCEIELIERFENTVAGLMPIEITRNIPFVPLASIHFDTNLDETVDNLQAFADKVDKMTLGGITDHTALSNIGTNTHAQIDAHLALKRFTAIIKSADESVNNSNTLQADDALLLTVPANKTVTFRGLVWFNTLAAADFKCRFNFAGSVLQIHWITSPAGLGPITESTDEAIPSTTQTVTGTGTTAGYVEFDGIAVADGSNRALTFQWAQNTATVGNTTVKVGSFIEYIQAD